MGAKKKQMTPEEMKFFAKVYKDSDSKKVAQEILAEHFGISERSVRSRAKKLGLNTMRVADDFDATVSDARSKEVEGDRVFVLWAQESTPVHKQFFANVEAYAKEKNATLCVIMGRYKNPNSLYKLSEEEIWWAEEVKPYLSLNRHSLSEHVTVLADVKVQPTATRPMNGFEGFESEESIILGHPRMQMKTVASLEGYRQKEIWTTGACTVHNYTDSRAGKKGEFHHTLGFAVVEVDRANKETYIRQVTADEKGSFIDVAFSVDKGIVTESYDLTELYHCGDTHFGEEDTNMMNAGKDLITKLKPSIVRLDDTFNGHSITHWEKKLPIVLYQRFLAGENLLSNELTILKAGLKWYVDGDFKLLLPKCNHDVFLDRYIDTQDWKKDIPNSVEYMECAVLLLKGIASKGLIPHFVNEWYPDVITLDGMESFRVLSTEQSVHGHKGSNGSRGAVLQFTKLSTKMFTGHTHSPSRYDGVCTSGTNTHLRVGFNDEGASSWAQCDQVLHKNGKPQQFIFKNYKFTTLFD